MQTPQFDIPKDWYVKLDSNYKKCHEIHSAKNDMLLCTELTWTEILDTAGWILRLYLQLLLIWTAALSLSVILAVTAALMVTGIPHQNCLIISWTTTQLFVLIKNICGKDHCLFFFLTSNITQLRSCSNILKMFEWSTFHRIVKLFYWKNNNVSVFN